MVYDVVVIGGGLAGLTAALTLSKEGKKVAVLEKHHMAGGYATNFKRKDKDGNTYVFDVALHGIGGLRDNNSLNIILKEKLGILENFNLLEKKETATILTQEGDEYDIPSNFDEYKEHLIERYTENKDQIENLFSFLMDLRNDMNEVMRVEGKMPKYNDYLQEITLYDFLKEYTTNEALIEEFSFLWLYYGLPPTELCALYYLLPWVSYHIGGTFYIEGGAGRVSDTLKELIEKNGSEVFLSSEVKDVNIEGNKIVSVGTKKGKLFKGKTFVIACDPTHIFSLVNSDSTISDLTTSDYGKVQDYKENLDGLEIGISLTQLYVGLDCKAKDLGIVKADYFIETSNSEECYDAILKGDYEKMSFGITAYDNLDSNLNGGKEDYIAICIGDLMDNWPEYNTEAYKMQKAIVTNILLDKAMEKFPMLRGHVKVLELGTPHTMKRYTNNSKGAVYGWKQSPTQGGNNRLSVKTPFENTYLAGSWTNPGGGFEGAMTSGFMTAERILKVDERQIPLKSINKIDEKIMNIDTFLLGMVANINPRKTTGLNVVYKFDFNKDGVYFIDIKHGKGRVKRWNGKENIQTDVTIMTDYKTWYDISINGKDGAAAYLDGEIKVLGNTDLFVRAGEIFGDGDDIKIDGAKDKSNDKKFSSGIWVNLALIPWIIFWVAGKFISIELLAAITAIYLSLFILIIKPKGKKELTLLEGGTLVLFSTVAYISTLNVIAVKDTLSMILDIGLILIFIFSAIINKPITGEYAKLEYGDSMANTKLFTKINRDITILWAVVFTLVFIVKLLLDGYIENIAYIFVIIGGIITARYPKSKMKL